MLGIPTDCGEVMSHKTRLMRLRDEMSSNNQEALLIEDPISLYYLTGIHLSAGKLLVTQAAAQLIVDGRYHEMAKTRWPFGVSLAEDGVLERSLKNLGVQTLSFSASDTTYRRFKELEEARDGIVNGKALKLEGVENPVEALRLIKEEDELDKLRKAAHLGSRGYDLICDLLVAGVTEQELAVELDLFWKRHGGKRVAFDPIVAFGTNTSMPHYHTGNARLSSGEPVLIDIGVTLDDYHSDMTRVVFFGEPDPHLVEIYNIVFEAQTKALAACKPGTTMAELDASARDHIARAGYGDNFSHSLGHGIGLEVHETPTIRGKGPQVDLKLAAGMVVTIEPGIYVPGLGGVRIEDTVVITADGYEDLTKRSKDLRVIR